MRKVLIASALALSLAPACAFAEGGAAAGAATGAVGGAIVGGPVGAVVGGVGGAIVGGIADADRPRFRTYVEERHVAPAEVQGDVVVGRELPATVQVYDVPSEYRVKSYRYTVVNGRTVLVDPRTHRIVEVIE